MPRLPKDHIALAREILGSSAYVNDWEKKFLRSIKRLKYHPTARQLAKLHYIAQRSSIDLTKPPPEQQPEVITATKFRDLENVAADMTIRDQQFYRDQLRKFRQRDLHLIDARRISILHQKYLTGWRKQTP